jgi:hypothetical protein
VGYITTTTTMCGLERERERGEEESRAFEISEASSRKLLLPHGYARLREREIIITFAKLVHI